MARTIMDIDPELLDEARSILGAPSNVAAVRMLLEQAVRDHRRVQLLERLNLLELDSDEIDEVDEARHRMWDRT
jgi:Arc/MetJ family transcription regulator